MPRAVGASGPLHSGGGAAEPGGSQAAEAGCVWESGYQQLSGLHPQGLLCGRHARCISGTSEETICSHFVKEEQLRQKLTSYYTERNLL